MSESKILTLDDVAKIEWDYKHEFKPSGAPHVPALCATVRQLLEENAQLTADVTRFSELADKRHDELSEAKRQRDLKAAQYFDAETHNATLRERVERLTRERNEALNQCAALHEQIALQEQEAKGESS